MRLLFVFLVAILFVGAAAARSTMGPQYVVGDRSIEFGETVYHALRKQIVSSDQLRLERHDEIISALSRLAGSRDAPGWLNADELPPLIFNGEAGVFLLKFDDRMSQQSFKEFERLFAPLYTRVCIDAEMVATESFYKETELLRIQIEKEKSALRRNLLEVILEKNIRIMRSM